jgi:N12 class adenine-specific DNA methylase
MSFAERFDRRPKSPYTEHVRPSRDQSLLPIFEPLPPHSVRPSLPRQPDPSPSVISKSGSPAPSGEKTKARDILAAIRTFKVIEHDNRPATPEEKATLSRFCGFGPVALSIFPDPLTGRFKDAGWEQIGGELKGLLTPEEYDSAKRTTFSQFFTSPVVMSSMHAALERLGVPADALVLEPGCGSGNFLSHGKPSQRFIGVELDSLSGRIGRQLHPAADIRIENFRDSKLPPLDAVIGNVPFADIKLDFKGQRLSLHDFFIAKSTESLKPGGILAVVTSHYTLDKQNAAMREQLAGQADFLGAIRLPSDAFKREGTAVVTDILFLRKRAPGQEPKHAGDWISTGTLALDGASMPVNRYFLDHPEMILGTWSRKDTLYGGEGFSVVGNGDLANQLRQAIERLPEVTQSEAEKPNPPPYFGSGANQNAISTENPQKTTLDPPKLAFIPPPPLRHITEGSFFVGDDKIIRQVENGNAEPVTYGGTLIKSNGTMTGTRLAGLIGLRDSARRVLQSQNEGWPEVHRTDARRELNRVYDRFAANYGPINKTSFSETKDGTQIRRMPNLAKFREDPDAMLVMSLEEYDEATGQAEKSAIMKKDVVGPKPPVTHVTSAEEGLLVSLDHKGGIDLSYITKLYGKPEAEIVKELGDLIYRDPGSKEWQTADAYLSGNVREKLKVAEKGGGEYARNAVALRSVQPEDVLPGDIDANLGAPWIPATDIQKFAGELFNVPPEAFKIGHLKKDAVWSVEPDYRAIQSVAATADYGTSRINGTELLSLGLNLKTPVIYDIVRGANGDERVLNPDETAAAREKQKIIKEKFKSWIFSDPDRTERLVRSYNDTYNNLRPRLFDGSHLDFPGMSKAITLRPHQVDAVWRAMTGGNTLLAHSVGAGKTNVCIAAAMKMKQAGLIKKPLVACPNHMLEQFSREWMQLYPNAKILVASKEDFTKEKRKALTAKIATGDWDGIIVTHSSFERIGMSKEFQERFLREQIKEYEGLLVDKASHGRNIIKTLEKQKARREEKLKDLLAEDKKDNGLVFDELGIDQIFYDEQQTVKNMELATKMERVAGINTGGSERAFDFYMKAKYLDEQHPGHGLVGASGTPISNSMVEMYTVQRYFDPAGLESRGIEHFDAWAASFGEVVDTMEISPDGSSLRPRSRFAKFVNLPELVQMFRAFADVQTAEDLNLPRPALEGGKPQTVACPMSEEQKELQATLIKRYDRIRSERVDPREDNALVITTDGRKLALDGRMLQAGPDHPGSKINALVRNVARIWKQTEPTRGTQMVFCDMGVHPTPWGFSAYDEVANKLEGQGIPPHQIAIMGDADTDAKKQALFEKVRQGTVRVLIGSTAKMGTGTNVQKRLAALHHLDAPWKPAEVEQREGRILRQGNTNKEVAIYRYVTEGSFDAFMWQALETKARFINQVMAGDCAVRKAEDIGGQELSYAEVKAIASGNPAVLTLAETDAELQRLSILRKNHHDEQYLARRNLRDLPDDIKRLNRRLEGLNADMTTMASNDGIPSQEAVGKRLTQMPEKVDKTYHTKLGTYHGLEAGIILHPLGGTEVYLDGAARCRETLMRDNPGPRAVLNALERLASGYGDDIRHLKAEIMLKEGQLRDYQGRLGKPFQHEEYASQLTDLRDQLKLGLSERAPEGGTPTAELAEQIKALRASVTVEAAPERAIRKAVRAERPVTARIRERRQSVEEVKVEPVIAEPESKPAKPDEPPPPPPAPIIIPAMYQEKSSEFRQQVAKRRDNASQLRLF